ncbi:MAG: hypothetical protein WBB67_07210 [bacterium]
MSNNVKYQRGSEWRKWDLHVHTPSSFDYQYHGEDAFEKIAEAINNSDIEVCAITDHFTIEGYEKLIKRGGLKKIVLPGIELKLEDSILPSRHIRDGEVQSSSTDTPIHLQVIFDNDDKLLSKIREFVVSLEFKDYNGDTKNLTKKNIIELGKQKNSSLNSVDAFKEGCKILRISKAMIEQKLKEKGLRDDSLVILPYEKYGGINDIDPENDSLIKSKLTKLADVIESSKNAQFFLGLSNILLLHMPDGSINKQFVNFIGKPKPCIVGSDAHKPDDIGQFAGNNYCWIKADPTFEGLKQIKYEPSLRVKVQEENPQESEVYARIEKCSIDFPASLKIKTGETSKKIDFCLQGNYEIALSNNLTCIIGGRGIGKSTLIHLLYNAWTKKDTAKLQGLNSPLLNLDFSPDSLRKTAELTTTEIPANTEFFMQNEIEKSARNLDDMSTLIRHRLQLFSSIDNQQSLKDLSGEWLSSYQSMERLIKAYEIVSEKTLNIKSTRKRIEVLQKQIAVIQSKEYNDLQGDVKNINAKISELNIYQNEHKDIITTIDILINAISQLNWNDQQGKSILNELSKSLNEYKKQLQTTFAQLETEVKKAKYSKNLAIKKQQLKDYLEKKGLRQENIEEIANATGQIKELEDEIRMLVKEKEPSEKIYSEKDAVLDDYKQKYSAYLKRYFEVVARLEKELEDIPLFDKSVSFTPKISEQHLRESVVELVKKSNPSTATLRTDDIESVLFDMVDIKEYLKSKKKIQDHVNQCSKAFLHKKIIQELVNDAVFLDRLYLFLWRAYYDIHNIQVQTKLGDNYLQNTSFGERCGIVVSIILIAGTNPIIIDQPEDNLDGKFISTVLVPLVRKRKTCRQIILITRDANIAIGGDAELIQIMECDEKKRRTQILPSSIENIQFRENYIWILDGGKEAFENREQKYGFKK